VFRETEGNPFFMSEVVRLLVREARLENPEQETSWSLTVPQGVREVVGRRLNTLSEDCNRVLSVASVVGREFEQDVLERVCDLDGERLLQTIDEAMSARLITDAPDSLGRYRFSHALVRETLYKELTTPRRVLLHRRVGEVLEERYAPKLDPHLPELAHHFFQSVQGGTVDKAIEYATRAGDHAAGLLAHEEAAEHYERALHALELQEEDDEERRFALLGSLGEAQEKAGERSRSQSTYQRAIEIARRLSDPELLARGVIHFADASFEVLVDNPASRGLILEALEVLPEEDSPLRAHLLGRLARSFAFSSRDEARRLILQAGGMAKRVDDPGALALALEGRFMLLSRPENARERLEIANEMFDLAQAAGDQERALFGLTLRATSWIELGDLAEADRALDAASRLSEGLRQPDSLWGHKTRLAMRALLEGRFEEAEKLAQEAFAVGQRFEIDFAVQAYGIQLSRVRGEEGRLDELEGLIKNFVEQFPETAGWRSRLAAIYAELDRREEAREHYEILARNDFSDIPVDAAWLIAATYLAQVCHYLQDTRRAEILYEMLMPCAELNLMVAAAACNGPVSRWLGLLAWTLGRWEDATRHFDDALAMTDRMRARPLGARTQVDYAEMLLQRDEPEDRERAVDLLNQAMTTARALGMKVLLERALGLKLGAQGVQSGTIERSIDLVAASTGARRPDLSSQAAPDGTVTLMFSDMEGFTAMTERLGDLRAREVIRKHNSIVREQLAAHGGYEVELQGDGFLLAFGSARQALLCAIAIQRAFAAHNEESSDEPIRVRIGLHTGEALKDADKFFGKSVILAARIAAQAKGGEILASSLIKQLTESVGDLRFDGGREVELKGFSERQQVHTVEWQ
jgi:class 3 adenylate cyclase